MKPARIHSLTSAFGRLGVVAIIEAIVLEIGGLDLLAARLR